MDVSARILILGGTGNFGARICRRLANLPGCELVITSRNPLRSEALVDDIAARSPRARLEAVAMDQDSTRFEADLRAIRPFTVVHTAGPYQGRDYRVANACIEAGCHYVDLADGRDFVAGFGALDARAREAGVLLVTGASTLPGLSSAVVRAYRTRFREIHAIEESIAPAQQTPRGHGTVAAVLSYCGRPFPVLRDGCWVTRYGWQDLRRQTYPRLGRRWSAACDVPDLEILPELVPGVRTVSFHAALESGWEHRVLWLMAWLTRWNLVRDWSRYTQPITRLGRRWSRFGSDRGGMAILLTGVGRDGRPSALEWQLVAADNHGPEIPCTPAIVIVRKLLDGEIAEHGARPCVGLFTLGDLLRELEGFSITATIGTA